MTKNEKETFFKIQNFNKERKNSIKNGASYQDFFAEELELLKKYHEAALKELEDK